MESRHASWLELFYDLLFVALIAQLAHGLVADAGDALAVLGLFVPVWWIWVSFAVFSNVSAGAVDSAVHRLAVLANMACLVVLAAGVYQALHGHPELFAGGYVASRLCRILPWLVALRAAGRRPAPRQVLVFLVSAALWAISIVVPVPWCYLLWAVALVLEVVRGLDARHAPGGVVVLEPTHLAERFGLFVIIGLGEGIALIVRSMSGAETSALVVVDGVSAFVLLAVLWWLYFDFGSAAAEVAMRVRPDDVRRLALRGFVLGHFLIVAGIMAIGAGLGQLVYADATEADPSPGLRLVCVGLAIYLTNNALLGLGLLHRPAIRIAIWYLPTLAILASIWLFADVLPASVALLLAAVTLAGASALGIAATRRGRLDLGAGGSGLDDVGEPGEELGR